MQEIEMEEEGEEDFQMISKDSEEKVFPRDSPGKKSRRPLLNLYLSGKYKVMASLYNFVHSCKQICHSWLFGV